MCVCVCVSVSLYVCECLCLCLCLCVCVCVSVAWPSARVLVFKRKVALGPTQLPTTGAPSEPPARRTQVWDWRGLCRPGKTENTMPSPCCQSGCCGANKKQGSRLCSQSLTGSTGLHRCSPCSKTSASSKLYGLMFSNRTAVHCVTASIPDSSSPPAHDLGGTLCDCQKLAPHHAPSPSLSYAYSRSPYQRQ